MFTKGTKYINKNNNKVVVFDHIAENGGKWINGESLSNHYVFKVVGEVDNNGKDLYCFLSPNEVGTIEE